MMDNPFVLFGNAFNNAIAGGFDALAPVGANLTKIFMVASIVMILWRAANGDRSRLIRDVLATLLLGFGTIAILEHAAYLKDVIISAFVSIGVRASGGTISADEILRSPFSLIGDGFVRGTDIWNFAVNGCSNGFLGAAGCVTKAPLFVPIFVAAGSLIFVNAYVAYRMLVVGVLISLSVLAGFGIAPMFVFEPLRRFGFTPVTGVINNGIKLMLYIILVGVGGNTISNIANGAELAWGSTLSLLIGVGIYHGTILGAGRLANSITSGSLVNASSVGAIAGMGTIAMRSVISSSGGAASAASAIKAAGGASGTPQISATPGISVGGGSGVEAMQKKAGVAFPKGGK